jgi:hypothetical protein
MNMQTVQCRRGRWQGRPCCILRNDQVELTHLTGGGQIPAFHFLDAPALNPFWIPRWKLRDPTRFRPARDEREFGAAPVGRLLSGIAGHSLCLGVFGMPSEEEIAAGAALHGEAGVRPWSASLRSSESEGRLRFSVRSPAFGLVFTRELSLRRGESVIRVNESVRNSRGADQFIQWQQHAALGPPFLDSDECGITLPGTRGITDAGGYEGRSALASDREFAWPHAPGIDGASVDLQHPCRKPGSGFVAGVQVDPGRDIGFICAVHRAERLAFGYIFHRAQFPWVTLWEENGARTEAPWRARERVRAFEFGVSPLPVGRAETLRRGEIFATPTLLRIPARGSVSVAWLMFLSRVPHAVRRVDDIACQSNSLRFVTDTRAAFTIPAASAAEFVSALAL